MAGELNGQVAIVTGAGRGFGRAIAQRLAAEGAAVTVTARTGEQLAQVVAEIDAAGGRAHAVPADVTSREDVARVVRETRKQLGPLDAGGEQRRRARPLRSPVDHRPGSLVGRSGRAHPRAGAVHA